MTKSFLLSRAVATATAALGACLLAFAMQGACAGPAAAFTPLTKTGSEDTKLNLTTSSGAGAHTTTSSGGASLVRTIVGLAIVIAVIWGLAWILKQVKAGKDPHVSSSGLASVAALTLGSGRTVHLVRAGSDFVLLGATEQGLSPIHRYTEEQAREAGIFVEGEPTVERSRLFTVASQLVAGAGRAVGQTSYAERSDFADPMRAQAPSSNLLERLREMTVRR
ncbi:MAG TPA: flagellar biosynthetic protein FliO [Solirubrobacteraceae bacterium]|nr:flagellar biosynthetic protein FliO [Solirubrobacteraceae bacterium]